MKHKKEFWNSPIGELSPEDRAERRRIINKRTKERFHNLKGKALIAERAKRAKFAKDWREKNREHVRTYGRSRNKTGEDSTPKTVLFYGYKEPLKEVIGGFGYQGVLSYSQDLQKIQCHLCGKLFRAINNGHLKKVHGITAAEYKTKFGLSPLSSLVGEATREKLLARPYNPHHMQELKKAHKRRKLRLKKGLPDLQSGKKIALEIYNRRGTCPDQLLDLIKKTIKSYGRVPTEEEFISFHQGKYYGSIRRTYGTWTKALELLGKRPHNLSKFNDKELIKYIKLFYKVNKRSPRWSEFNRGLLPAADHYYKRYKFLNYARLLANVPLLLGNMKRDGKKDEYKPKKAERERLLKKFEEQALASRTYR